MIGRKNGVFGEIATPYHPCSIYRVVCRRDAVIAFIYGQKRECEKFSVNGIPVIKDHA